jgi:hypothetical protein
MMTMTTMRRTNCRVLVQQQQRSLSQIMSNFVRSRYFDAYKAVVLPKLKEVGLGEEEAAEIVKNAKDEAEKGAQGLVPVHRVASELALATVQVVSVALKSKELGIKVARDTLLSSQMLDITTNRVVSTLTWDKTKFAEKTAKDFCRDNKDALDISLENPQKLVVKKCFYHQFFSSKGIPELTKIFCEAEKELLNSASSPNRSVLFFVDQTIADGASECVMRFEKKS